MQLFFDFPPTPDYSFKSFVACNGNSTAMELVKKVMDPESAEKLLFLYGEPGSGKTHLLSAVSREIGDRLAINAPPIIPLALVTVHNCPEITRLTASQPVLLLDDLHLLQDSSELRSAVWQLFNDFYESGRTIIATASLLPKELQSLDEHLQSRFMWGLVARLDISDDDSRRMIMKKLADDNQIIIPDEVIDHLLIHLPRDIPSLANALELLKKRSFATQKKISLKLAREAILA